MKLGINQFCWPTSMDVREAMEASKRLGYETFETCFTAAGAGGGGVTDALDISAYHNHLLNMDSTDAQVRELRRISDDLALPIHSVGGIVSFSIYPLTAEDAPTVQKSEYAIKKMLDAAQILGASTVLVIPGMLTENMEYAAAYARVQERLSRLADYAPCVDLAVENVWNNFLYSPLELSRFVDETGRKNLGIYFDVANARRFGYPQQWIKTMGGRIKGLHLKDYRMSVDNIHAFTNLLDGDVDWTRVSAALGEIGYFGDAVVELIPPARSHVELTLAYAKATAERLFHT